MGVTIIAPSVTATPPSVVAPIVQIKENWQSLWQNAPDLLATSVSTASAGQDLSRLVFHRRYGFAKDTYEPAISLRTEKSLLDQWIRVRTLNAGATDLQTVFLGRISGDDASKFASSSDLAGVQQWVAYGPAQILRKRFVGKSYHNRFKQTFDNLEEIGWVPPLNEPNKSEVGNRSSFTSSVPSLPSPTNVFMYGGTELWNYRQYVEYLLTMFLDESANTVPGPKWFLTGQAEILEDLYTPIRWGTTQTISQMLRKLIPLDRGIDYTVRIVGPRTPSQGPDIPEEGFEIFVYATSPFEHSFAGVFLPKNPNDVVLQAGNANDLSPSPRVVVSHDRKFKRIRILGKRIVVCCSNWAAYAPGKARVPEDTPGVPSYSGSSPASFPTLVDKWGDAIETEYKEGSVNSDDEADHDEYRRQDKFRDVYCSLGAPALWDMESSLVVPHVDNEGLLVEDDPDTEDMDESLAPYQLSLRRTLSWIPLKEGEDWTDIASEPLTPGRRGRQTDVDDHQADYLPPIAWLFEPAAYSYVESTQLGVGVRPKRNDWGVLLRAAPNHIMGQNHFGNEGETALKTAKWPRYDWQELIVTLAFEADQRYTMEWSHADATDKDGILEIAVDAEMHYLAPNTVVASPYPDSPSGVVLSGDDGRVIRADRELMGLTMAGAISRYGWGRDRATVAVKGLLPWHDLVGQMLNRIDQTGSSFNVNGVISGVTWDMALNGSPSTIIKAGYPD